MMRKILITGGLGYVGGRVARHFATSTASNYLRLTSRTRKDQVPAWLTPGEVVAWDSTADDPAAIVDGIDTIVHFAALNEIDSARDPVRALQVNGVDTLRLLRAAEVAGVRRFIYFSTAHVYGAPLAGVITEAALPRPQHPYAISHKAAEDYVLASHDQDKIEGVVLRLSNGFGAPIAREVNRWTLIANDLCRQAVTTQKLVLKSSGLQRRDFVTLADVGRCVEHFVNMPTEKLSDGLFNLGGDTTLSMIELANLIADRCKTVLGFSPQIERPMPGPGESAPDLKYAIQKLMATGFSPCGDISEEIDSTLRLCQKAFGS